jgi:hypothetical protein
VQATIVDSILRGSHADHPFLFFATSFQLLSDASRAAIVVHIESMGWAKQRGRNGQCVPMLQPSENSNKKSFGLQFGRRIIPLGISVDPSITGSAGLE